MESKGFTYDAENSKFVHNTEIKMEKEFKTEVIETPVAVA